MINWKNLFGEAVQQDTTDDVGKRNAMLEKLFSANKGISELTGASPESVEEMMKNPDLYAMLNEELDEYPKIVDEDGTELQALDSEIIDGADDDLERAFREAIESAGTDNTENSEDFNVIDVEPMN